jgi:hypothetical protein
MGALYGAPLDYRYYNHYLLQPLPGQETTDDVLERAIGGFVFNLVRGRYQTPFEMHCCTANGNQGFYYAWEAAVRGAGDTATINLLFNRFSPWLDLFSYLPYEGKAVIRNKKARKIHIRIPGWVKQSELRCTVNGASSEPTWSGRMISFYDVPLGAEIVIEFPLTIETVELLIPSLNARQLKGVVKATYQFKGSTCIGVVGEEQAFGSDDHWVKLYQREQYLQEKAPMVEVPYREVDEPIQWY